MSSTNMPEYEYEAIRGLPGPLPAGETLLWQGSPSVWLLARRALRVVPIAVYFLVLALWQGGSVLVFQHEWLAALRTSGITLLLGGATVGILCLIAWGSARATVYSITSARVVIRHGMALTLCLNIPFRQIDSVALCSYGGGAGELALNLTKTQRLGYLVNWPHVRPLQFKRPEPALRGLSDVEQVSRVLTQALAASGAIAQAPKNTERAQVAIGTAGTTAAA